MDESSSTNGRVLTEREKQFFAGFFQALQSASIPHLLLRNYEGFPDRVGNDIDLFVRRTDATGSVAVLGHTFAVDDRWVHRLVRAEVNLDTDRIRFYALRRREPSVQPLLLRTSFAFVVGFIPANV